MHVFQFQRDLPNGTQNPVQTQEAEQKWQQQPDYIVPFIQKEVLKSILT